MQNLDDNKSVALIIILVFLAGLLVPLLVVHATGYPSHQTALSGIPVLDSVFAELVKSEPDPVVLPQSPVVETDTSITMESDYGRFVRVNESEAISIALDFIPRIWYLSDRNFSIDTGWTRLESDSAEWVFRFHGEGVDVYVNVNAISGKVNGFTSHWAIDESPFVPDTNTSDFANSPQLEQLTFNFLDQFNYSLSPYSRYVGPTLIYDYGLHHDVFQIFFYNIVNESLVRANVVSFSLDVKADAVLSFRYLWEHIDAIPTESIISSQRAEQLAVDYVRNTTSFPVVHSTTLVFDRSWTPLGHWHRLAWIVSIESDSIPEVYIDAKSGTPYSTSQYVLYATTPGSPLSPGISRPSIGDIVGIFLGSTAVAIVISLIAKRQMMFQFKS